MLAHQRDTLMYDLTDRNSCKVGVLYTDLRDYTIT